MLNLTLIREKNVAAKHKYTKLKEKKLPEPPDELKITI